MARNRVIYQSEALYVGPTTIAQQHTTSNVLQLQRVQSANYSFNLERQDVNQFGELASIDRVILSAPTVSLDFSYLVANLHNESGLGFTTLDAGNADYISCISGILNKSSDEKNYFIKTVKEGADALSISADSRLDTFSEGVGGHLTQSTIGVGNGFITSYTAEGSVGNFPTATVNVEALNMVINSGASGFNVPSVNPADGTAITAYQVILPTQVSTPAGDTTSVLRPGQVTVGIVDNGQAFAGTAFDEMGVLVSDAKIQSYNISFDLGRTPLEKLGSKFAFAREIDFPVTITASIEANVGELTTGNLADMISTDQNYDLFVRLKDPTNTDINVDYHIKKAKLDSEEFSSSIGDNKSVTLNFSAQVGGPSQNDIGFFMSGQC
jgi:hypothetical protein